MFDNGVNSLLVIFPTFDDLHIVTSSLYCKVKVKCFCVSIHVLVISPSLWPCTFWATRPLARLSSQSLLFQPECLRVDPARQTLVLAVCHIRTLLGLYRLR